MPSIDWGFISLSEGGQQRQGYVPTDSQGRVVGKSGVTIATGVDLGQRTAEEIRAWFPSAYEVLINTLTPYAGLTGDAAVAALERHALWVPVEWADKIDEAAHKDMLVQIAAVFDRAGGLRWDGLPSGVATAYASVAYQYGPNLDKAAPNFYRQMTSGDWWGAFENLRAFGDQYPTRRMLEAGYLAAALGAERINRAA